VASAELSKLDRDVREVIDRHALTGKPLLAKKTATINDPLAQLGKRLFFSMSLSGQEDTACVSCHHPLLGGGDNLSLSIGVNAIDPAVIGPGRRHSPKGFDFDGGPTVPRNAQTTFNTVFYNRCMFWDCRIESLGATPGMNGQDNSIMRTPDTMWGMPASPADSLLQAQAGFPVTAEDEMRARFMRDAHGNEVREALAKRLRDKQEHWLQDFQIAFKSNRNASELIVFENISAAIAAYEESQVFVDTPWKKYVAGNLQAIEQNAKRGALLFYRDKAQGGVGCARCHRGDLFSDENFYVMAVPQIGRGTEDGAREDHDYGRFLQTGNDEDRFAFRTPTLLNIEVTRPYGHNGAYEDLREMIRHMLNPIRAIARYPFRLTQFDANVINRHARENTREVQKHFEQLVKKNPGLVEMFDDNETQVEQLHAFLLSLTDPCVKNPVCMAPWLE